MPTMSPETPSTDRNDSDAPAACDVSITNDFVNVARGFCMGAADVVPGVSGGTVALILGHYERLIQSISKVDTTFVKLIASGKIAAAARHIDLRFLAAIAVGIATGIVALAGLMHWLLDQHMPVTLAAFSGLILASAWMVRRYISTWTASRYVSLAVGVAVAVGITLSPIGTGSLSLPFLFVSASIAICAMILPGISGAFILLLLGVYHPVTGLLKEAVKGNFTTESLTQIAVFICGCIFGLLFFAKLLRWLLARHHDTTMACLLGLMVGSLAKLWPLQQATTETAALEMKLREFVYFSPAHWPGNLLVLLATAAAAAAAVLIADRIAAGRQTRS